MYYDLAVYYDAIFTLTLQPTTAKLLISNSSICSASHSERYSMERFKSIYHIFKPLRKFFCIVLAKRDGKYPRLLVVDTKKFEKINLFTKNCKNIIDK